jgi:hypothetical protein
MSASNGLAHFCLLPWLMARTWAVAFVCSGDGSVLFAYAVFGAALFDMYGHYGPPWVMMWISTRNAMARLMAMAMTRIRRINAGAADGE